MKMMNEGVVRSFWKRLNHTPYGLTELVAIGRGRIEATGFFDDEEAFVSACRTLNKRWNVYAGRNPRTRDIASSTNIVDRVRRVRAKDADIKHLTGISLDIDPIRSKDTPATTAQHNRVLDFALKLQKDLGGFVDDSGNGAYLWIQFSTPIEISPQNAIVIKKQCEVWQQHIKQKYNPQDVGLRIDGCFDFSRLKRVIGTNNYNAGRQSGILKVSQSSDLVRSQILSISVESQTWSQPKRDRLVSLPPTPLPQSFQRLLKWDLTTKKLWTTPDPLGDRSKHDWKLGMNCVEAGITKPEELAAILMRNPNGKYRRDGRLGYLKRTIKRQNSDNALRI